MPSDDLGLQDSGRLFVTVALGMWRVAILGLRDLHDGRDEILLDNFAHRGFD
jgi:hypothetical protein